MAKHKKKTNYREKYPNVNSEVIQVLEKSDRQMEYLQYDIKIERCQIDYASGAITYFPSREDSLERLLEENKQFAVVGESVDDTVIKTMMIEKMLICLKQLDLEEQRLITDLFFKDKSERKVSGETGVPQRTIHDRKVKVLIKLKKLMEK